MSLKWFVVHTYSGYENRVKKSLEDKIIKDGIKEFFGDVLIPTENVIDVSKVGRRSTKKKFFPGYILVQMEMNDKTWHMVRNTPKVTGFVGGNGRNPPAIPDGEVERLTKDLEESSSKPKMRFHFEEGEQIRIREGPFANFQGSVDSVNSDKQKLRVLVSIFGRQTPVELDFIQVEKA